ncbi:hypothetical protein [Stutzerimonas stutzeri]|uniref:hypothetical protein n=1 Tax=Stutzerimonas stutzeri TaxID=316 RepID=UPI003DA11CCE
MSILEVSLSCVCSVIGHRLLRVNNNRLGSISDDTTTKVRITRGDAFWPNTSRVMEIDLSYPSLGGRNLAAQCQAQAHDGATFELCPDPPGLIGPQPMAMSTLSTRTAPLSSTATSSTAIANGELVVEIVAIHPLSPFTLACFASIAIG